MVVESRQFLLPKDINVSKVLEDFGHSLVSSTERTRRCRQSYYDSFDWRVFSSNAVLLGEEFNGGEKLLWQDRDSGEEIVGTEPVARPGFVWDLPPGALHDRLVSVLEMRRLLPVMRLNTHVQNFHLENSDTKIVLRLSLEQSTAIDPSSGSRKRLPQRLCAQMLKGYSKPYRRLIQYLQHTVKLQSLEVDLLTLALTAHGRKPGDDSARLQVQLEPDMRADHAMRVVLQQLLDTMERNEAGLLADIDSEFLHDFRVAGRRSRSLLSQVKQVLPKRVVSRLRNDFAWLNQTTSLTRDMDVYLLTIPAYQASLPIDVRADLEPLRVFLQQQQRMAHRQLVRDLKLARYRRFKQGLQKYLAAPLPQHTTLANARRPVKAVADERIWRMFRRTIKEGESIGPDSVAEALHELRKTCKKLRYLLECFSSLYPAQKMNKLIKSLKGLQNNLGDFQDLHIQINSLQEFSARMLNDKLATAPTVMAMGMLVENLEHRQRQAREDFETRFAKFATEKNRRLFHELFVQQDEGAA